MSYIHNPNKSAATWCLKIIITIYQENNNTNNIKESDISVSSQSHFQNPTIKFELTS